MDSLYLQDIEVWTRIGVPEEERAAEQRLLVSVELFGDLSQVARTDDVSKGIDYERVTNDIRSLAGTVRKTVERFVEDIADMILKTYAPAGGVKVSAQKFILPGVKAVHVTVFRKP
jgi:dihydroneopterin aldolase